MGSDTQVRLDWGKGPFSVSSKREKLRQQIVEDPYDLSLREVYADLAIEEGDPRGEYVRIGLRREALRDEDADTREEDRRLASAMEDLRARYGRAIYAEWFGSPVGAQLGHRATSRVMTRWDRESEHAGFVARIWVGRHDDSQDLRDIVSLAPIMSVRNVHPSLTPLKRVRGLSVTAYDRDVARVMKELSAFRNLEQLEVRTMTRDPAESLPFCEQLAALPRLQSLSIDQVDDDGFRALSTSASLTELRIIAPALKAKSRKTLARDDAFVALRSLHLEDGKADPIAVAEFAKRRGLRTLKLQGISISKAKEESFYAALDGALLRELMLSRLRLKGRADPLGRLTLPRLHTLDLSEAMMGASAADLAGTILMEKVDVLSLQGNAIKEAEMEVVAASGLFHGVRELVLSGNKFKNKGGMALGKCEHLKGVRRLRLNYNWLGVGGVKALLGACAELQDMEFGGTNNFGDAHIRALCDMDNLNQVRTFGIPSGASASKSISKLLTLKKAEQLRELPTLSSNVLKVAIDSPHLDGLAKLGVQPRLFQNEELLALAQRRFGHRVRPDVGVAMEPLPRGPVPEPDLDPWWS